MSGHLNRAVVFVKPHAAVPPAIRYVREALGRAGINILAERLRTGEEIAAEGVVDLHYAAIADYAMAPAAAEALPTGARTEAFAARFGVQLGESGIVSADALLRLSGLTAAELGALWVAGEFVKLAPGYYAGRIELPERGTVFVVNGFYPVMREKFTRPGVRVLCLDVAFDPVTLPWQSFRARTIGATDPARAAGGSLRAELGRNYATLGLAAPPTMQDNGVHASAGPLEGSRERLVWLGADPDDDPFLRLLGDRGLVREKALALTRNPVIRGADRTGPAFDLTEDLDADRAADLLAAATEG